MRLFIIKAMWLPCSEALGGRLRRRFRHACLSVRVFSAVCQSVQV